MLHYPAMNYLRLMFFFIPIGASHDLHYLQFGGPIAAQVFYIMIGISCSGFEKTRDKVLHVFADLFFILICLSLIAVGLAESVNHSEVSVIAEKVFFSFVLAQFSTLTFILLMDIYTYFIAEKCLNPKESRNSKRRSSTSSS